MKKNLALLIFYASIFSVSVQAQSIKIDSLDTYIPKLMNDFGNIGLSVSIVQNGEIIYAKGFGKNKVNTDQAVDKNTLFGIGSISKSFTPIALAMLVDEGKLNWDDKVINHLPYFQLYDTIATQQITVRDLLIHNSGLPEVSGGTLWYHSDLSRREITQRLKYLKPNNELRTEAAYQNIMYIVAAEVLEAISKKSWENFIQDRILTPLAMEKTVLSQANRSLSSNISQPHIMNDSFEIQSIKQEKLNNMMPAGGIYSCATDMAKYMNFLLNEGIVGSDTLVSQSSINEIFKPQIHYQQLPNPIHNEFTSYGLGWWLTPQKEHKIIEHSGGIDGMVANLMMVKDENFGIIVLTNSWHSHWSTYSLTFDVIGSYLNDDSYLGTSNFIRSHFHNRDSIELVETIQEMESMKRPNSKPTFANTKYAGSYFDRMYGNIQVQETDNMLVIEFEHTPIFRGKLTHWYDDTFKVDWTDPRIPDGLVIYELIEIGEITGFHIDQKGLLDVDFSELEIKKRT